MIHPNKKALWLVCLAALASCSEEPFQAAYFAFIDNDTSGSASFAKELKVSPDGGKRRFTLVSNRAWSIDYEKAPWIKISPTSGYGVAAVTFDIAPNTSLKADSIVLNITNNTLPVVRDFKVTRQNFFGTYPGKAVVLTPITQICTACVVGEEPTTVTSSVKIALDDGEKTSLTFKATVPTNAAAFYTMEMLLEDVERSTPAGPDGKIAFVFRRAGSYDLAGLGAALNDPAVTGVKEVFVDMTLQNDILSGNVWIDPAWNGDVPIVDAQKTTVFGFTGRK